MDIYKRNPQITQMFQPYELVLKMNGKQDEEALRRILTWYSQKCTYSVYCEVARKILTALDQQVGS